MGGGQPEEGREEAPPPSKGKKDQGLAQEDSATSSSVRATVEGAASEKKPSNGPSPDHPSAAAACRRTFAGVQTQLRSDAEQSAVGSKDFVPGTALLAYLRHCRIVKLHRSALGFAADKPDETL